MTSFNVFERQFDTFSEIYDKELVPRKFDVYSIMDGVIIALYTGNFKLRKQDENLEAVIFKRGDKFILRTDTRFYINRVKFDLSEPLERVTGYNDRSPIYGVVKVMNVTSLDDGIEHFRHRDQVDSRILFINNKCMDVMTHVGFGVAKSIIKEHRDKNYEISTSGFSDDDLKIFGLKD